MRVSRNRYWGNPNLVAFIKRLGESAKEIGWSGILVGDMSQPRGGPMFTGHTSHQVGLDVDIGSHQRPTMSFPRRNASSAYRCAIAKLPELLRRGQFGVQTQSYHRYFSSRAVAHMARPVRREAREIKDEVAPMIRPAVHSGFVDPQRSPLGHYVNLNCAP